MSDIRLQGHRKLAVSGRHCCCDFERQPKCMVMDTPAQNSVVNEPDTRERRTPVAPIGDSPEERVTGNSLPQGDATYRLETPARCPQCGEVLSELRAIRLLRAEVNFTSMLPRRGRIVVCPFCQTIVPAELTNF